MAARPTFDPDSAYITHPHAAALHYEPLPAALARQLANLRSLMRHAPNDEEFAWLVGQEHALQAELDASAALPVTVRNTEPRQWTRPFPKHETKYALRSQGPTNKSGKARS
jgi:hypothetical protein